MKIGKTSKDIGYENLAMDEEDLRFATNRHVARYRAEKLKCDTLVEIGAGVGLQTIAFSKTCKKVYAIEINKRKIEHAKKNIKKLRIKNVEFIEGDALNVLNKVPNADVVFCETERTAAAKQRKLNELSPNISQVLKAYGKFTDKFCIEIPPQIKNIGKMDCEMEYLSVDNKLNRLNLLFGSLKKDDKSVVALPGNDRLTASGMEAEESAALKYLYDVDTAVIRAGMINDLAFDTKTKIFKEKQLTSKDKVKSPFFRNSFLIMQKSRSFKETTEWLKKNGFGKVVLRQKINPEDYWKERKKYEKALDGKKTCHLFVFKRLFLIAKKE